MVHVCPGGPSLLRQHSFYDCDYFLLKYSNTSERTFLYLPTPGFSDFRIHVWTLNFFLGINRSAAQMSFYFSEQ